MEQKKTYGTISRRGFGRKATLLAGAGALGTSALGLGTSSLADDGSNDQDDGHSHGPKHAHERKGYFGVQQLPFHLQHEFLHAISCNNVVAKAVEVQIADGDKKQHTILQRPGTFGWGTITFFLQLDEKLVGQDMTFQSNVGWSAHDGRATGEVVFSVGINGDIVIDGGRSSTGTWAEVRRTIRVRSQEMRVTLMVDSIQGNNKFDFWWGEPQMIAGSGHKKDHDHKR